MSVLHLARKLDAQVLRDWPLPVPAQDADKEGRGHILVIAGSREIPGAAVLTATAALRAGAGKLAIAAPASIALALAFAVPESRVIALPETAGGGLDAAGIELLARCAERADAAVIGPGLMDEAASCAFTAALLPLLAHCPVVLDAAAMNAAGRQGTGARPPLVLTPHAGEMAHLSGDTKEAVQADAAQAALDAAAKHQALVALKGSTTLVATPQGQLWKHDGGNAGLATSGSGDVLAGIIGGLAARGAPLEQATAWGVVLHALAGDALARRIGPLGYLARELPGEIPALLAQLAAAPDESA